MNPDELFRLALQRHQSGELAEAKAAYERCLALSPNHPHALANLGSVCRRLGNPAEALQHLRRAVALLPTDAGLRYNLANALRDSGDLVAAETSYCDALALAPNDADINYNLALLLADTGRVAAARDAYRQVLAAKPDHWEARLNLAVSFASVGEVTPAQRELAILLEQRPDFPPALNNLAALQQDTGQTAAALQTLKRTAELDPDLPQPRSNLLMALQYHAATSPPDLLRHAHEWGCWAMQRARAQGPLPQPIPLPADNRPLRVGYVSADLSMHPVGLFLKDVVAAHDPGRVIPIIYSNGSVRDAVFAAIVQAAQSKGGGMRDVRTLDDAILAAQIRADDIDVLIDLSGHTGKSRLAAFAWKPAPLQISWLGYFATTGLPAMDFVILDPFHAPSGTEAQFTEAIIRLPHNRFCFSPVSFAPEVSPPPFLKNHCVTFGSFNNTAKLNDAVLDAWARILAAVPQSRLVLKWRTFADAAYCQRILDFFATRGIAAERLDLRPMSVHRELLEQYADIDIALDPFPFSGGHTSCESLWMGVPVVTLPQERVVSRQTWSFLNNVGLPGLAAGDVDGYVALAVRLAHSSDTLVELRQDLREKMRASTLCDITGFTRLLEAGYRQAWAAVQERPSLPTVASAAPTVIVTARQPEDLRTLREKSASLQAALEENADQPDLWLELAEHMASLLQHVVVIACADEVLLRRPADPAALTLKGNALRASGHVDAALACYREVLNQMPGSAVAHCNLGVALQNLGRYEQAIAAFEAAIARHPGFPLFWGNLAAALTYSPSHTPAHILAALKRFDTEIARPLLDRRPHTNDRTPNRRLRVGYVSPDFRKHAVAYFALPLIEGHHRDQVEVFCYYNHRQDDDWTAAFRNIADHWLDCARMTDGELANRIRADGIDILVDLAGHTENNRLLTFAYKPAPVQVTWMGYVTTTGMSAMDWRVTHLDADPPGTEADYTEKLCRLPGTMWCYRPLPAMPDVSPAPLIKKGYVTFGSFNRYSKNSTVVLDAWAQILNRVPNSHLVICVPEGDIRQQMTCFFSERGIPSGRISAFAKLSHEDFWKLHADVDIALDPFPFGGGTTTCESLWLGVPVVSCSGRAESDFAPRFASRMGYAFLNNIGVPEFACMTIPDYIETTVALAHDHSQLKQLRQTLREKMANSPLTDEKRFVGEMEQAYRMMWQEWLQGPD